MFKNLLSDNQTLKAEIRALNKVIAIQNYQITLMKERLKIFEEQQLTIIDDDISQCSDLEHEIIIIDGVPEFIEYQLGNAEDQPLCIEVELEPVITEPEITVVEEVIENACNDIVVEEEVSQAVVQEPLHRNKPHKYKCVLCKYNYTCLKCQKHNK